MTKRFSERYRLARIRNEGVLLDLETGSYFGVQGVALAICTSLAARDNVAFAAADVARKFDVSLERAKRDVTAFLGDLRVPRRPSRRSPFRVRSLGFELHGPRGAALTLDPDATVRRRRVDSSLLRVAAPHVLALRGEIVLHASAVLDGGKTIAFVGASGTGKTTIAKLLEHRGAPRISDDLVVLDDELRVRVDGERAIRAWSRSRDPVVVDPPLGQCTAKTASLAAVMILARTEGIDHVTIVRAGKIGSMAALFENAFVELPRSEVWAHALETCRRLVARGIVFTMRVPEGRRALSRALRKWSERGLPTP